MTRITLKDERLMEEIMHDATAYELLRNKCRWEAMGKFAVLREFGDPREWAGYQEAKNATIQR